MASKQDITRSGACDTRRALITALGVALATPVEAQDAFNALYAPLAAPEPQDWGEARTFLTRFHRTGERAVTAAEGALASPDDCAGIVLGRDGVLRILLPGGIAVSQLGVEAL